MLLNKLLLAGQKGPEPSAAPQPKNVPYRIGMLIDVLKTQDTELEDHRSPGWIHVSSLLDFCPRRQWVVEKDEIDLSKSGMSAMRIVWAMGRAAEHHLRMQIIKAWDYENIIGKWTCVCGDLHYEGFHDKQRRCHTCRKTATIYGEFSLRDFSLKIVGHPDLLIWSDGMVVPVEIKSIKLKSEKGASAINHSFESVMGNQEPVPNHAFQVTSYRRLLADRNTLPISRMAIVMYVAKDYSFKSPYLEFHVDTVEGTIPASVNQSFNEVALLRQQQAAGEMPPRLGACGSHESPCAKKCPARVGCFSRQ